MGCCYSLAFNIAFKNDYTDVVYSNLKNKQWWHSKKMFYLRIDEEKYSVGGIASSEFW